MASKPSSPRAAFDLIARLVLVALPLLTLPAALLFLLYNYAALGLIPQNTLRHHTRRSNRFQARTIVITGISTPAGLRVARAFYQTGHNVVGVEILKSKWSCPAQWSRAVQRLHVIRAEVDTHQFIEQLLDVVDKEKASLWIDCLGAQIGQAQAKHVIERRTTCVCLVPDVDITQNFKSRYDFLEYAHSLELPALEMHRVRSRNDIHSVLNGSKGKRYLLSTPNGSLTPSERAVLPRRTPSQTYQDISQIKISQNKPLLLEQHIDDLQKYSAQAVVSQGQIRAFVVCSESMHGYQVLSPTTGLFQAMQKYVQDLASCLGADFSSHLCVDFCIEEKATKSGVVQQTLPMGARLNVTSAITLFAGKRGSIDLTKVYLSSLEPQIGGSHSVTDKPSNGNIEEIVEPVDGERGVFQLDQSVISFLIAPLLQLLFFRIGFRPFLKSLLAFFGQVLFWRESVYEFWDPMPAFAVYFLYTRTNLRRWFELVS